MSGSDQQEQEGREYQPSQRRLDQAREQGDAPRSEELQAAAAAAGLLIALLLVGDWAVRRMGNIGMVLIERAPEFGLAGGSATFVLGMILPSSLLLLVPATLVLIWLVLSRGLTFAPSRLQLKPSRLSVLSNARQKFGMSGLLDFGRRLAKLLAIAVALTAVLRLRAEEILASGELGAGPVARMLAESLTGFLALICAISVILGTLDFLWQRFDFLRRNRMTRKEMTDEMKESEGDPHMKADRRRRAREIAGRRMLADVATADVVIVNPEHYAVALKWDRHRGRPPVCVARGIDEIAARIREAAQAAGVPIHRDPPTARLLHAVLDIGDEIHREHYAAVAAAIRFADMLRARARRSVLR